MSKTVTHILLSCNKLIVITATLLRIFIIVEVFSIKKR
jgi:hypothetical protein